MTKNFKVWKQKKTKQKPLRNEVRSVTKAVNVGTYVSNVTLNDKKKYDQWPSHLLLVYNVSRLRTYLYFHTQTIWNSINDRLPCTFILWSTYLKGPIVTMKNNGVLFQSLVLFFDFQYVEIKKIINDFCLLLHESQNTYVGIYLLLNISIRYTNLLWGILLYYHTYTLLLHSFYLIRYVYITYDYNIAKRIRTFSVNRNNRTTDRFRLCLNSLLALTECFFDDLHRVNDFS